jgi:ubiquinone/menaquinone biosynthesis C-methylase UbiE
LESPISTSPPAPYVGRRRKFGAPLTLLLVALFTVGGASTALWLARWADPNLRSVLATGPALLSGAACVVLTSINVVLRWFRWHFLVRRFSRSLTTRDSFAVYLATLPSIVTPFLLGELVRVLLLRKRVQIPATFLVRIWFAERSLEASVLLTFYLWCVASTWGAIATLALLLATPALYNLALPKSAAGARTWLSLSTLAITVVAWLLPIVGLFIALQLLAPLPTQFAVAVRAFTAGTLQGGLTGLPLGVFVTGSTMISQLIQFEVPPAEATTIVLLYRAATSWFAVCLGLAALWLYRKRLRAMISGGSADHFDEIASEYEDEIPAHVRERLLRRKIGYIQNQLLESGVRERAHGLDLGCGQGWYFIEFARLGYQMDGLDYSGEQVERARLNLRQSGIHGADADQTLVQGDAMALPYPDNSFDFAYSINAFHHILAPNGQRRAFQEVVRVLKPGGVFVLHEMNTHNPVFRLYMGYVFPLLKKIDEGNEIWLMPDNLPKLRGAKWLPEHKYFTFLPDFVPSIVQRLLGGLERRLERSSFGRFSAHYQACLVKER